MDPVKNIVDCCSFSTLKASLIMYRGTLIPVLLVLCYFSIWSFGHFYYEGPRWKTCNHRVISYEDGHHTIEYNTTYTNPETGYSLSSKFEYQLDAIGNVRWNGKQPVSILKKGYIPRKSVWTYIIAVCILVIVPGYWIYCCLDLGVPVVYYALETWVEELWRAIPINRIKRFLGR